MTKKSFFVWTLITIFFLATRLTNLGLIPIFTDEAIYLRWSQIISRDLKFLYLPLTDGKPPLFMWITAVFMKVFSVVDPLIIGRLISVGTGFLTLGGIFFTARQLFKSRTTAYLAVIFYLISPFTFFYDRFALADGMLAMFGIWSLGLGVVLVRTLRWRVALALGLVIGLGWLTKTPALFFLAFLPVLIVFERKNLLKLGGQYLLVAFIARVVYSIIFLLPQAYVVNLKNYEFIVPVGQFLQNPWLYFWGNVKALLWWEATYLTWPVVGLIALSVFWGIKQKSLAKLVLLIYFGGHFIFMSFFNKVIYPRFLLTFTPMLLILAAAGLDDLRKIFPARQKLLTALVMLGVLALPIYTDLKLLTDPTRAPIADNDSMQYLNSWSAGWGIRELNNFFTQEAKKYSKITVGVEGTFGLMPYVLELYQNSHPNLEIKPYWPLPEKLSPAFNYFIVYQSKTIPKPWKVELITRFQQGTSSDYLRLYKVLPGN